MFSTNAEKLPWVRCYLTIPYIYYPKEVNVGMANRRIGSRISMQMFLNEYVKDKAHRCMAVNLSPSGIYLNRLLTPFQRENRVVGLEFELPDTSEVIWARGEVRFDQLDKYFHGTGVEFTGMATAHQRLIRDYVLEKRERALRQLLARVRRNRLH